ncbi:MAG: AAA family ATPase [Candidatus Thermochlorobacter sp.]
MQNTLFQNRIDLSTLQQAVAAIKRELRKVLVGQDQMLELLLAALFANGHVLIEGVPGIAKTLTAKLLARTLSVGFSRIQFTPDLMPSDVIGTSVFNPKTVEFTFNQGPIFSNFILIDEINRAPAKTQSALFEVMEERQVTVDGHTYLMQKPFLVIGTQNPIEQEGTYRLPEAQLDRFLFKIVISYPSLEEEAQILLQHHERTHEIPLAAIEPVLSAEQIVACQAVARSIKVEENLIRYIAALTGKTRASGDIYLGASPRASIAILTAAKAIAAMQGRDFLIPDDIKTVAIPALRHRIILTPEREMQGASPDDVLKEILAKLEIPR